MFTEQDWLLLLAIHREKVFTLRLWLRFAVLLLAVVAIGSLCLALRIRVVCECVDPCGCGCVAHRAEMAALDFCASRMSR